MAGCPEEFVGRDAYITFVAGYTLHVFDFTVNEVEDNVEASSTDSHWKLNLAGLSDVSGSYSCRADKHVAPTQVGATGNAIFHGLPGHPATWYVVPIRIVSMDYTVPHDGPADLAYGWIATGCVAPYFSSSSTTTSTTTTTTTTTTGA